MHEFDEENLEFDNFIKQKLEKINPLYEESAWQALEANLDALPKPKPFAYFLELLKKRYIHISTALVLLLLIPTIWICLHTPFYSQGSVYGVPADSTAEWLYTNAQSQGLSSKENQQTSSFNSNMLSEGEYTAHETIQSPQNKSDQAQKISQNKKPSPTISWLFEEEDADQKLVPFQNATIAPRAKKKQVRSIRALVAPNNASTPKPSILKAPSSNLNLLTAEGFIIPRISETWVFSPDVKALNLSPKEDKPRIWQNRKFLIGLNLAPEFDQISIASKNQVNPNVGIHFAWNLSHRLSISTGVNYTAKSYQLGDLSPNELQKYRRLLEEPSEGVFVVSQLESVKSDILDIPLEVNYALPLNNRFGLFFSSGFSSYLFLNQSLNESINFVDSEGRLIRNIGSQDNQESLSTFNFAGTLNLGIGAQYRVNDRVFFQFQPYYKLGLKDLGSEGVRIHSFGLRTKLLYGFGKR